MTQRHDYALSANAGAGRSLPPLARARTPVSGAEDILGCGSSGRWSGGPKVRRWAMVAGGILLVLLGLVWTLQGVGVVGGSPMTGVTIWAVIGPVVGIAGLVLLALGLRRTPGA